MKKSENNTKNEPTNEYSSRKRRASAAIDIPNKNTSEQNKEKSNSTFPDSKSSLSGHYNWGFN